MANARLASLGAALVAEAVTQLRGRAESAVGNEPHRLLRFVSSPAMRATIRAVARGSSRTRKPSCSFTKAGLGYAVHELRTTLLRDAELDAAQLVIQQIGDLPRAPGRPRDKAVYVAVLCIARWSQLRTELAAAVLAKPGTMAALDMAREKAAAIAARLGAVSSPPSQEDLAG